MLRLEIELFVVSPHGIFIVRNEALDIVIAELVLLENVHDLLMNYLHCFKVLKDFILNVLGSL